MEDLVGGLRGQRAEPQTPHLDPFLTSLPQCLQMILESEAGEYVGETLLASLSVNGSACPK
ncbi:MAG: hypothetical protein AUI97_05480 [Crenarchaeota archaeon 13_1_40CM_3_52_17]|nr:MAG: hypothetical protein AUI97_05480 [Crenarchaeota archaeon 13_1_40CM_3_52_17]